MPKLKTRKAASKRYKVTHRVQGTEQRPLSWHQYSITPILHHSRADPQKGNLTVIALEGYRFLEPNKGLVLPNQSFRFQLKTWQFPHPLNFHVRGNGNAILDGLSEFFYSLLHAFL